MWKAARATTTAPTLFKRIVIGTPGLAQPFIGGGMGCNNPIVQVLEEAKLVFSNRSPTCIISIGAGQTQTGSISSHNRLQQTLPLDVVTALQEIAADCERGAQKILMHSGGMPGIYFRFIK